VDGYRDWGQTLGLMMRAIDNGGDGYDAHH